ncbi:MULTISPECIES: (2Fe-2S)-binding protein [Chelativorans]|jgi:carbon-monoxide dehydrogenase small subunit|nr:MULTISPECIES: (2Fe-2S)-binding protein [Chelativorans]
MKVNGVARDVEIDERMLLAEVLRGPLGLKGTRIGCLTGDCGACTILFNGELRKSCLMLAQAARDADVQTIEHCSTEIDVVREAFVEAHGFQCGFCTSGMILVAAELLNRDQEVSAADIRQAISGNLCRCTGYDNIVVSIQNALARNSDQRNKMSQDSPAG